MIRSKADYVKYLDADRIALGREVPRISMRLVRIIAPDHIWNFQRALRRLEYYKNVRHAGVINRAAYLCARLKYRRLSIKLGLVIPENVFGPGLAIVHPGTIVVNENARVGANCRIHPGVSIGASGGGGDAPQIGDNVYLAPGAKIFGNITIPSNTAIGANSVVTKSFVDENTLIAGIPAKLIKQIDIRSIIKHI